MAFTTKFAYRYRKGLACTSVGVRQTATTVDSSVPTITSGTGAPSAAEPNGSLYMRTNASTADDALYSRIGGSWVALDGAP
tara:strand:- start:710 stop:952 length:243 start_codon:yes stop_codon:yes gene_type:complete